MAEFAANIALPRPGASGTLAAPPAPLSLGVALTVPRLATAGGIALHGELSLNATTPLPVVTGSMWLPGLGGAVSLPKVALTGKLWLPAIGGSFSLPVPDVSGILNSSRVLSGTVRLPALAFTGSFGTSANLTLPKVAASGSLLTGATLTAAVRVPRLAATGTLVNSQTTSIDDLSVDLQLPRITAQGRVLLGKLFATTIIAPSLGITGSMVVGNLLDGDARLPAFELDGEMDMGAVLSALLGLPLPEVAGALAVEIVGVGIPVLVINLDKLGRTEYSNFPFNSMTVVDGKLYGAASDGLYLLEGDTDNGAKINAVVRTGLTDFGSSLKKNVSDAYLGFDTAGEMSINSITDNLVEGTEQYKGSADAGISGVRAKLPLGTMSRYWGVQVKNVDGCNFALDSIELRLEQGTRRV